MADFFQWQPAWVALPQLAGAIISVVTISLLWRRRHQAFGVAWMIGIMAASGVWTGTAAFELLSVELGTKIVWSIISYTGILGGPVAFVHFTHVFVRDGKPLPRWASALTFGVAGLLYAATLTQPWHHLLWTDVQLIEREGLFNALYVRGPFFWLTVVFCYSALLGCAIVLAHHALVTGGIFRRQTWIIIAATLAPLATSLAYLFRLGPLPEVDQTPVGFVATGLLLSWAMLRVGLFDLVPVATHTLFERMKDPLLVVDPAARLVQTNHAAREMLGPTAQIGLPLAEVLAEHRALKIGFQAALDHPQVVAVGPVWWEIETTALLDPGGRPRGRMYALRDITASKTTELALREKTLELHAAVARADELAEAARAANVAKTTFLAQVSHDLRTPLHAIIGTAELMDAEAGTPSVEGAATIREAGESLLRLINDLLDLSRIEAGHTELADEPFLLDDVFDPVADLLTVAARRKELTLLTVVEPGLLGHLRGDADRLRQILLNLGGNAIKFTRVGRVTLRAAALDENRVRIVVSDTGPGIAAAHLPRLFESFNRGDPSTARQAEGTGLGLAISRQLARAMGGDIHVQSTPGTGSTFTVELPLIDPHPPLTDQPPLSQALVGTRLIIAPTLLDVPVRESLSLALRGLGATVLAVGETGADRVVGLDPDSHHLTSPTYRQIRLPLKRRALIAALSSHRSPSRPTDSRPSTASRRETPRIPTLLADDDRLSRQVTKALLTKAGCIVTAVEGGLPALHALRQDRFQLVVLDGQMGDLSGWQVARRLRDGQAGPLNQLAPIIALTADLSSSAAAVWRDAGVEHVVGKPLRLLSLQTLLPSLVPAAADRD